MPQRRAAKKDLRQSAKRRERNLLLREQIKTALKKFKKAIDSKDASKSKEALNLVYKIFDRAASKNLIHPNKAARKKGQFAKIFKKLGV